MTALAIYHKDLDRLPDPLSKEKEAQATSEELVRSNLRFAYTIAAQYRNRGLEFEDLICLANQGLIEATRHFDPSRGCRFITFAVYRIRAVIQHALEDPHAVHLPANQYKAGYRLLIESLNVSVNDDGTPALDLVPADDPGPDREAEEQEACTLIAQILHTLPKREQHILTMYYGLDGPEHTLDEIGKTMGLSKERIRQLKDKALQSLLYRRAPSPTP